MAAPTTIFVLVLLAAIALDDCAADHDVNHRSSGDSNNGNVAFFKNAYQSSTYISRGYPAVATRAIDGNAATDMGARSCTHTRSEVNPWWKVDLGVVYGVRHVNVTNRGDCCGDRLHDFTIFVSNGSTDTTGTTCTSYTGRVGAGMTESLACQPGPVYGRYLTIQINTGRAEILTLCEVQVEAAEKPRTKFVYTSTDIERKISLEDRIRRLLAVGIFQGNPEEVVPVHTKVNSIELIAQDPESRYFTIDMDVDLRWFNPTLPTWNPQNVSAGDTKSSVLWIPKTINKGGRTSWWHSKHVYYNGTVAVHRTIRDTAACVTDWEQFPYDVNFCNFTISGYDGTDVMQFHIDDRQQSAIPKIVPRGLHAMFKVDIVGYNAINSTQESGETFSSLVYTVKFQRRASYYSHAFLLPPFLLMLMTPFVFIVPSKSGERTTLGGSILLLSVILLGMLDRYLPSGHMNVPNVVRYYSALMVLDVLCVAVNVVLSNLTRGGNKRARIPDLAKWVFLDVLSRYVLVDVTSSCDSDLKAAYTANSTSGNGAIQIPNSSKNEFPAQSSSSQTGAAQSCEEASDGRVEMRKCAQALAQRGRLVTSEEDVAAEWALLTTVLDRMFFALFFLVVVICDIAILSY